MILFHLSLIFPSINSLPEACSYILLHLLIHIYDDQIFKYPIIDIIRQIPLAVSIFSPGRFQIDIPSWPFRKERSLTASLLSISTDSLLFLKKISTFLSPVRGSAFRG